MAKGSNRFSAATRQTGKTFMSLGIEITLLPLFLDPIQQNPNKIGDEDSE